MLNDDAAVLGRLAIEIRMNDPRTRSEPSTPPPATHEPAKPPPPPAWEPPGGLVRPPYRKGDYARQRRLR